MTRDEMIRLLVIDRLEHRDELTGYMHLQRLLEHGFRGFRNLSDRELHAEMRALGIDAGAGVDDVGGIDFDDDEDSPLYDTRYVVSHAGFPESPGEHSR